MEPDDDQDRIAPRRLRRAEAVLARRTSRVVLVLEQAWNDENVQAVLRTAEAFGVQHVWLVLHPHARRRSQRSVTRGSHLWLSTRAFDSTAACIEALREEDLELWVSDLSRGAQAIHSAEKLTPVPRRVALVIGREVGGASPMFLAAADRRLYLPMHGFTESLNLSVAAALLLQRMFDADATLRGALLEGEAEVLREKWYLRLAGEDEAKQELYRSWLETPPEPLLDPRPEEEHRKPRIKKSARPWQEEDDAAS